MSRPFGIHARVTAWGFLWATAILLFLVLQLSPLVNRVTEDESMLVYDAHRVATGQVPYRDFFAPWAPGGYVVFSGGPWGWWGRPETGSRYLQVGVLLLFTVLLARALRPWGRWAWPLAALFPVALFPMSAFMGNHWFSVLALSGAAIVASRLWEEPENPFGWVGLGALAALAGWFLQTDGFLATVLALVTLLVLRDPPASLPKRIGLSASGAGAMAAACLLPLLVAGAGRDLLRDAVLWPLVNYRRPGNVADLPLLADLPSRLSGLWVHPEAVGAPAWLLGAVSGSLLYAACVLGAAGLLAASLWYLGRRILGLGPGSPGVTTASVQSALALLLFSRVNPTWVHFIYAIVPMGVLWALVPGEAWHRRWRSVYGPAIGVILGAAVLFHGRTLLERPHAWWEFGDVDRVDRESPLNRSLRELPFMGAGDTIADLPFGGSTYLYTYPAAVGYTQLFVLELDHHTLEDHGRAAGEIASRRPKLVLLHAVNEASFMAPGDPISRVVREGYERWTQTPSMAIYLRKDVFASLRPSPHPGADGGPR